MPLVDVIGLELVPYERGDLRALVRAASARRRRRATPNFVHQLEDETVRERTVHISFP